jgi:hypothetical protein
MNNHQLIQMVLLFRVVAVAAWFYSCVFINLKIILNIMNIVITFVSVHMIDLTPFIIVVVVVVIVVVVMSLTCCNRLIRRQIVDLFHEQEILNIVMNFFFWNSMIQLFFEFHRCDIPLCYSPSLMSMTMWWLWLLLLLLLSRMMMLLMLMIMMIMMIRFMIL